MLIKVYIIDTSFDNEGLTYFMQDGLKKYVNIGSIVSVPLRDKIHFAIVVDFLDFSDFENVKSVVDVTCSYPVIDEYQIKLIENLSKKYFLATHRVINLFLPKFIFNRLEKNAFLDIVELNLEYKKQKDKNKVDNIFYHNLEKKDLGENIINYLKNYENVVFVLGDDIGIDNFLNKYKNLLGKDFGIYKNSLSYSKKYKIYLEILSKKNKILIGTRKILQYNLANYNSIVYLEDAFSRFNYNQSEKFLNIDIIKFLILQNKFNFIIISTIPQIIMWKIIKELGMKIER